MGILQLQCKTLIQPELPINCSWDGLQGKNKIKGKNKSKGSKTVAQREQEIIIEYLRIFARYGRKETYALLNQHIGYQAELANNSLASGLEEKVWKLEVLKKIAKLIRRVETVPGRNNHACR